MIRLLVVTFFMHLSVCSAGDSCPPKAQLAPCTCSQISPENVTAQQLLLTTSSVSTNTTADGNSTISNLEDDTLQTIVLCNESKSIQALEQTVSSALNRMLVDKLVVSSVPPIKEHTLSRLPSGWLKKVRVRNFEVLNTKMSGDFISYGNPFEGQEKCLVWFAAHNCFLSGSLTYDTLGSVNTKGLYSLPFIQGLDLSHNLLTVIMATSFRYPPSNLSTVILSYNSIQSIESETFSHVPLLRYIDLSHNLLKSIKRNVFASSSSNLKHIDLSWNSLTTLPTDLFNSMHALKTVDVSNNFLYSLPEKPWHLVWRQLNHIDVTGNFVECNCDLLWLLPILSPPATKGTTSPATGNSTVQTVLGDCSQTVQPQLFAINHKLTTLTRDNLVC